MMEILIDVLNIIWLRYFKLLVKDIKYEHKNVFLIWAKIIVQLQNTENVSGA